MSPTLANFLFEAVNFLLLAAALGWALFKPVRRTLDAERERHDRTHEEADRLRAEAEALTEQAREARQTAEREIEQRRREILSGAEKEAAGLVEQARKTQRAERQALEKELEAARNREAAALSEIVGSLAADAVRRLLEALSGPSLDGALVRAACAELERLPAEARGAAQVESARALDAEARKLLEDALGGGFAERVVAELGAGVRVTTPAGQVDATAASLARYAGQAVARLGTEPAERPTPEAGHG